MGHVGHELLADSFQLAEARDVVQHGHDADAVALTVAQGRALHLEQPLLVADVDGDLVVDRRVAAGRAADENLKLRVADDLHDGAAVRRLGLDLEQPAGRGIDRDDPLVGVDREDALDHAGEHGLPLVGVPGDRADLLVEIPGHVFERVGDVGHLLDFRTAAADGAEVTRRVAPRRRLQIPQGPLHVAAEDHQGEHDRDDGHDQAAEHRVPVDPADGRARVGGIDHLSDGFTDVPRHADRAEAERQQVGRDDLPDEAPGGHSVYSVYSVYLLFVISEPRNNK